MSLTAQRVLQCSQHFLLSSLDWAVIDLKLRDLTTQHKKEHKTYDLGIQSRAIHPIANHGNQKAKTFRVTSHVSYRNVGEGSNYWQWMLSGKESGYHNKTLPMPTASWQPLRYQAAVLLPLPRSVHDNAGETLTWINHSTKQIDLILLLIRCDLRWSKFVALMLKVGPEGLKRYFHIPVALRKPSSEIDVNNKTAISFCLSRN